MLRKIDLKSWKFRLVIIVIILFGTTGAIYFKKNYTYLLSPGHLSSYHKGEVIQGVTSHAEIEKKCSHCHAPIHCVTDTRCQDCHMDIAEQRSDPTALHGLLPGTEQCQNCHPEHKGAEATLTKFAFQNVDHFMLSDFSIETHKTNHDGFSFTCTTCHSQVGDRIETIDCITCHSQQDHDALAAHIEEYGSRCSDCHDGKDRMTNETFDHNTVFVLDGAHADQTCTDCHAKAYFEGKSTTCSTCHEDSKVHLAKFGSDCSRCHSTTAWTPAELRRHTFSFEHGDEVIQTCETCHTANAYTTYTCTGCHEQGEMAALHLASAISDSNNCSACHFTGLKGEVPLRPAQLIQNHAKPGSTGKSSGSPSWTTKPATTPAAGQNQGQPGSQGPGQNMGSGEGSLFRFFEGENPPPEPTETVRD